MTAPAAALMAAAARMGAEIAPAAAGAMIALLDQLALETQNVTAIDPFEGGLDRHLADSLTALTLGEVRRARTLVDIGSGGGFPGLPLAIARPDCAVTLVESERKKAEWIARAGSDLPNVRVVADRSETLAVREREAWDVATARAVAPLAVTLELAAPLVATGGTVVVWRGPEDPAEERRAAVAAAALGLGSPTIVPVTPFAGAQRHLHVYPKQAPTPHRFPRRPGRAAKRPLA